MPIPHRVIVPAVPGWVFLLFALLFVVGLIVVAILVWGFVKSLYLAVHPHRDGTWRTPIVLGVALAVLGTIAFVVRTDERALDDAVSEVIGISTLTRSELSRKSSDADPPCRRAVLRGRPGRRAPSRDSSTSSFRTRRSSRMRVGT